MVQRKIKSNLPEWELCPSCWWALGLPWDREGHFLGAVLNSVIREIGRMVAVSFACLLSSHFAALTDRDLISPSSWGCRGWDVGVCPWDGEAVGGGWEVLGRDGAECSGVSSECTLHCFFLPPQLCAWM